jgi:hypothetical protein
MLLRTRAMIAMLAVLLMGCSAGGAAGPAAPIPTPTIAPTPTPQPTPTPTPTPEPGRAGILQSYTQCKAVVQPEIDVLGEISARLTAGINIKDYTPLVDTIPSPAMDRLAGGSNRYCRNVVAEDAASVGLDHMEASAGWSNCLSFPTSEKQPCIDKIVQRWWSKSTNDYNKVVMDMASLQQGLIPPLDADPIYDQESPKVTHTPAELANLACQREYSGAASDLFELGRVLAEGTSLKNYGAWLNKAFDDLAKVDTSGLDGTCLISVGAAIRTIANDHQDARDAWRSCAKQKTQAKYDACNNRNVQPIWAGRATADYIKLFDAMGTLYLDQIALLRPEWLPHATP